MKLKLKNAKVEISKLSDLNLGDIVIMEIKEHIDHERMIAETEKIFEGFKVILTRDTVDFYKISKEDMMKALGYQM
jgi:hypothetical protein